MKKMRNSNHSSIDKTIGEYIATDHRTVKVFEKYGLDLYSDVKTLLSEACQKKDLDQEFIMLELESLKTDSVDSGQDYTTLGLTALTEHISKTHHSYIKMNVAQILSDVLKISGIHGGNHPELYLMAQIFTKITRDIAAHIKFKEESLFPAIRKIDTIIQSGKNPKKNDLKKILATITKLSNVHVEIGDSLREIRYLTKDFTIPGDGCNTLTLTYMKLKEFSDQIHKQLHLENNILYPMAVKKLQDLHVEDLGIHLGG